MIFSDRHLPWLRRLFYLTALVIIVVSTVFSNHLAGKMAAEEQAKMELWTEAIRLLAEEPGDADMAFDYTLPLHIIEGNKNIPVVLLDADGQLLSHANLSARRDVRQQAERIVRKGRSIDVMMGTEVAQTVYYDDSRYLKQLRYFPYIQLSVMFLFLAVVIYSLNVARRSEQNRVWVGLSKETAHQLGTPITSLTGWVELLRLRPQVDDSVLAELDKDTRRLKTIAERFSKIGSVPEPEPTDLGPVVAEAVDYMRGRCPRRVSMLTSLPDESLRVSLNVPLFEWVIENLCKNAIDAMDGEGTIRIAMCHEGKHVLIDVSDTGHGIPKNRFRSVFRPGYTTKTRGWGLGLSLAKRIVEEYHHGKIFVKSSEPGKGTTFRIQLETL